MPADAQVVRFIVYSDYLCPWCWNASRRLQRLENEYRGQIEIDWRSYLLRPHGKGRRDRERFRRYTMTWSRPGAEPDAGSFQAWASEADPPTHSVPAHQAAKAAANVSHDAFARMHARIMEAYFEENQDISSMGVLKGLWSELNLPMEAFAQADSEEIMAAIFSDFEEAQEYGATGAPAIRRIDNDAAIVGAHPEELYRRWIDRSLERGEGLAPALRGTRKE